MCSTNSSYAMASASSWRGSHWRVPSAREALVTALPPVLFGLGFSLALWVAVQPSRLVIGGPTTYPRWPSAWYPVVIGMGVLELLVVGVALIGAWNRLPRWSLTWGGSAVLAVAFALMMAADERAFLISPLVDPLLMLVLIGLCGVVALAGAWRDWRHGALVGMGACAMFTLFPCFFMAAPPWKRLDLAMLIAPVGVALSLLIFGFLRSRDGLRWVFLVLTAALNAVCLLLYTLVVLTRPELVSGTEFVLPLVVMAQGSLLGPLLLSLLVTICRGRWMPQAA